MDVTRTAAESAVNRHDPGRAKLAQEDPLVQPDKARPRNTFHQLLLVGHTGWKDVDLPGRIGASLGRPWCRTRTKTQRIPPTSPGREPRLPDSGNLPATEKGAPANSDLSSNLTLLSREPGLQGAGPRGQPNTRNPRLGR